MLIDFRALVAVRRAVIKEVIDDTRQLMSGGDNGFGRSVPCALPKSSRPISRAGRSQFELARQSRRRVAPFTRNLREGLGSKRARCYERSGLIRTLKSGIIDDGFVGMQHVEAVRRLGYAEVAEIAEHSLASASASAEKLSIL